ncbi:hypothetical protein JCM24511_02255 [Saitozyma sp. JCM 24511]|nr:hypothetical protein JCM24511_02255 [Saitozyma sp. JCM 24511]
MTSLIPRSLPPDSLNDTVVMIVLDWTKPSTMINELLHWLVWVDNWAASTAGKGQAEEMRERLQSHLQHYVEPVAPTPGATSPGSTPALPSIASMAYGNAGPLLPLGPGTLTLNSAGVPIVVVLTRADLMDSAGEGLGMKGAAWEERTDWVQQVLRTICLAYGASLFYTAPTQPTTYTLLRSYLLHRLYSIPPPLTSDNSAAQSAPIPTSHASARFPFPHRANVLDRDAVMVPSGWDSWGKINVLREGFDPARVGSALEASLGVLKDGQGVQDAEGLERIWESMIPEVERVKLNQGAGVNTTVESEQSFLSRHLDALLKDPNRDPRQSFRHAANTASANASHSHSHSASGAATGAGAGTGAGTKDAGGGGEMDRESRYAGYGGVVGPMGTGGLSLPGVEKAMVEMEGGGAEEIRERFARLGRRESARGGAGLPGPLSPTGSAATGDRAQPATNEALHNFFQGLLANKGKSATPSRSTSAAKNPVTEDKRERTVSGGSAKTDRS